MKIKIKTIAFALLISLALLCGCGGNDTAANVGASETSESSVQETAGREVADKTIKVSENYSYTLPEEFVEADEPAFEAYDINARFFVADEGERQIRSWANYSGEYRLEDAVEVWQDDGATVEYEQLENAELVVVTNSVKQDSETVYLKLLAWMGESDHACLIEIASFDEDFDDLTDKIKNSIAYHDSGTVPPGYSGQPSQEEIDNAMLHNAQEAMEKDYEELQRNEYYYYQPYGF